MKTLRGVVGIVLMLGLGSFAATPATAACFDCLSAEWPDGTTRVVCLTGGPNDGWEICVEWGDSYCYIDWPCGGIGWHFPVVSFDVDGEQDFDIRSASVTPRPSSHCGAASASSRQRAVPSAAVRYAA